MLARRSRLAVTFAVVAVSTGLGSGLVGVASADGVLSSAHRRAVTKAARAVGAASENSTVVSKRGTKAGPYVVRPSQLSLDYGHLSNDRASHLTWVDWGQPVAFASGDILIQTSTGGYESFHGALVLAGRIACRARPTYYYKTFTAYTPSYKYVSFSSGSPQLASPC